MESDSLDHWKVKQMDFNKQKLIEMTCQIQKRNKRVQDLEENYFIITSDLELNTGEFRIWFLFFLFKIYIYIRISVYSNRPLSKTLINNLFKSKLILQIQLGMALYMITQKIST